MLTKQQIQDLFKQLNAALRARGEIGEVGIVGGAVMCLVYNARQSTKDIDAIFEPAALIRELCKKIARDQSLPVDWLNDAAKGFLRPGFEREEVLSLSNLRVWAPDARYMLAMKCVSARWDTHDRDDVIFLIKLLEYTKAEQVFDLISEYYPKGQIEAKTQFFIEEVFEEHI